MGANDVEIYATSWYDHPMQVSANVILQTKLRRPPLVAGLLGRPRLLARLDDATACTLTLVTAPAGWGKTSLVSHWLAERGLPAAWLQLDTGDGNPSLFFSYLVNALRQLEPQFGTETEILLRSAMLPPVAVLTNTLNNEIDQMQRAAPCLLVLDDYHLVQSQEIDRALTRLVQHPPRDFHLIVLSRQQPNWSLSRLRLQDRLLEMGVADLRFTREEIATYLDRSAGLALPSDLLARLQKQTEGWAAGLQLAALALRQQHDAQALLGEEGGLAGFVGSDNRYLLDYMVDEVLADLPAGLLSFMCATSVCTHFSVELCQVLAEVDRDTARRYLRTLQEADLFLMPLDAGWEGNGGPIQGERRAWYRYHHLMQQTLAQRLLDSTGPDVVAELHRRAATWLGDQGYIDEALDHLTQIADWDTAVWLIARQLNALLNREDRRTVERWLSIFPAEEIEGRPTLLLMVAWICFFNLDIAGLAQNLAALDTAAAVQPLEGAEAVSSSARDWLPEFEGHRILLGGVVSYFGGQLEAAIAAAQQALTLVPRSSAFVYGSAWFYLVTAMQYAGRGGEAEELALEAYRREQPKPTQISARLLFAASSVQLFAGRLSAARESAELLLRESRAARLILVEGWAHDTLGRIDYERNDLDAAEVHFAALRERCYAVHRGCAYDGFTGSLLVAAARGRSSAVAQISDEWRSFEQSLWGLPGPLHYSAQARAALLLGDLAAAERWAATFNTPLTPVPMFWLESSHITKLRCLLASSASRDLAAADTLAAACLAHAERLHNQPAYLTLLALRSLLLERTGQRNAAVDQLKRCLHLAAPEGLVRTFVDLGPSMWNLLGAVNDAELADYIADLRAAFSQAARPAEQLLDSPGAALTQRELEVLALLATPLSLQEIGEKLFISYSTVRQHTAHIYEKLGVNKRRHAVLVAAELGLLPAA